VSAVEVPEDLTTVVVSEPFQVAHQGVVYGPGDRGIVPATVAASWALNGWVTTSDTEK
jgi:hypothetical protein